MYPHVALGVGLRTAGHDVRIATSPDFEGVVRGHGLDFASVGGDPRRLLESAAGRLWNESGRNPVAFVRRFMALIGPVLDEGLRRFPAACEGSDLLVLWGLGLLGWNIAERDRIPFAIAPPLPIGRTRTMPNPLAIPDRSLGGPLNALSWLALEQAMWQPFRGVVDRWRREQLGLGPAPFFGIDHTFYDERGPRSPLVYGYSEAVVPRPRDWPAWHHITGYWQLAARPMGQLPPALEGFLTSGPAPVYVGFGDMVPRDPEKLTQIVLDAIRRAGVRAVLLGGWAELGREVASDGVFVIDVVPHEALFPRVAAVVHHGGAGTIAAGLRAGAPTVVIPFQGDQPFWGARVERLGAGPRPIPYHRIDADGLARAINAATTDRAMRHRAAEIGERIRAEDGVAGAVRVLEAHLTASRH